MTELRDPGDAFARSEACAQTAVSGLYLLGTLDPDREIEFERHLPSCPSCLDECDRLGPLVTAFGEFPAGEVDALSAEFDDFASAPPPSAPSAEPDVPVSAAPDEPSVSAAPDEPSVSAAPDDPAVSAVPAVSVAVQEKPAEPGTDPTDVTGGSSGPAGSGHADRPRTPSGPRPLRRDPNRPGSPGRSSSRPRTSRRRRAVMASLAVLAGVSFATAVALYPDQPQPAPPPVAARPVSVVAESSSGRVRLSVVVDPAGTGPRALGSLVEATLDGLEPGTAYRLYAVSRTGQTSQVTEWTADAAVADVRGEVAGDLDDLAFFSVTRQDGSAVVSARVVRPQAPR